MRVTTAFNRMLAIPGAWVDSVAFTANGVVIGLRRKGSLLRCPCGFTTRARYDSSTRRWRHLDAGASQLWLEAEIRRLDCRDCGRVRTEDVPWARPTARHSRDFEDVVAWLAQRMDKTSVATLLRASWEGVDHIVRRVVADHLDDARLEGIYRLGVDEIGYKRGHQYLTIVANHATGGVVWVAKGKGASSLVSFYEALGPERCQRIEAVSMDLGSAYQDATRRCVPDATMCFDPYHVVQLVNRALDAVYNSARGTGGSMKDWRRTRYALRAGAEHLTDVHRDIIKSLRRERYKLWRAWELKERLRDLYRIVDPADARGYLKRWCRSASQSRIPAFVNLARSIRRYFDGIIAAVELKLSNSRLEGINAKIRLISRRGYGHHSAEALTSMIYLCLGGITIQLPTQR